MRSDILACMVLGAALLAGAGAWAQQAPPSALDAIPDKMPFSEPYGAPISAQRAQSLIQAAAAEAAKRGWAMNIAVVDSGANLVALAIWVGYFVGFHPGTAPAGVTIVNDGGACNPKSLSNVARSDWIVGEP